MAPGSSTVSAGKQEEDDKKLQNVQFIDIQWLSTFGVNKMSALDYFYTSPFFDPSSNNQRIRVQGVEADRRDGILTSMTGLEFMLDENLTKEPNLYVIRKQNRKGPLATDLIDVYYIADGIIFQAPEFYELLQSRLNKISLHTTEAFALTNSSVRYDSKEADISANGAYQCWLPPSSVGEGGNTASSTTKDSKAKDGKKKQQQAGGARKEVMKDFPSFKSVILDAATPTFMA
jgi:hypothetical protein